MKNNNVKPGSVWEKTKEGASHAWDKTKEFSSDVYEATKNGATKAWDKTKELVSSDDDKEMRLDKDKFDDEIDEIDVDIEYEEKPLTKKHNKGSCNRHFDN